MLRYNPRALSHVVTKRDLSHTGGIMVRIRGNEQNSMAEEQFSTIRLTRWSKFQTNSTHTYLSSLKYILNSNKLMQTQSDSTRVADL